MGWLRLVEPENSFQTIRCFRYTGCSDMKTNFLQKTAFTLTAVFLIGLIPAAGQAVAPELFGGLKWRLIGPFRGGRVAAVAGVSGEASTFYFGAVDGGVWKTTDAGVVWNPDLRWPAGSFDWGAGGRAVRCEDNLRGNGRSGYSF